MELIADSGTDSAHTIPVGGKTLALVAFLACSSKRRASRDRVAELLWATSDPDSGLQSIRQARASLKRAVGEDVVIVKDESLFLSDRVTTDRDAFTARLANDELAQAIECYGGPFCDGFAAAGADEFERWVTTERASLRASCAEAVARLAKHALAEARATDALALARRLSDVDPDDERRWRIRIEALLIKHDDFGTSLALGECHRWLDEENREPSSALARLLKRAADSGSDASNQPRSPEGQGFHLCPDLVGRERPFAALLSAWNEVETPTTRCIVLQGASGLGKSRLLQDVAHRLASARARMASVRAIPGDRDIAFALLSRLAASLGTMRGAAAISEHSAAVLVALNPALSSSFRSAAGSVNSVNPELAIAEALHELLDVLATDARLAVMVDDLHWADAPSARVLVSLVERQAPIRLLVVLATRARSSSQVTPVTAAIHHLEPLTVVEVEALLASVGDIGPAATCDWVPPLQQSAAGNPLIVLETLRLAMDAGYLALGAGGWVVLDRIRLLELVSRPTATAIRLGRLDDVMRYVVRILAVAGRPLAAELLRAEPLTDGRQWDDVLRGLEVKDIAYLCPEGWTIAHDAVAEAVLADTDEALLRRARSSAGRILLGANDAPSLRTAAVLLAEVGLWSQCARAIERLAREHGAGRPARGRAREELLVLPSAHSRRETGRRLPLWLRITARKLTLASVAVIAGGLGGMVAWSARAASPGGAEAMELIVIPQRIGALAARHVVRLDVSTWRLSQPLTPSTAAVEWPDAAVSPRAAGGPNGAVARERTYGDAGSVEVALWYPGGREDRLTNSPGDDVPAAWSPDRRVLLIASSRMGHEGHRSIFAVDVASRGVRRISAGGGETFSDDAPSWSSDGSRIAFVRRHYDDRPAEVCIVDSDGTRERCRPLTGRVANGTVGWLDPKHVALSTDSAGVLRTASMTVADWSLKDISEPGQRCDVSPDGVWVACINTDHALTVAPTSAPGLGRQVALVDASSELGFAWRAGITATSYIHRLVLDVPGGTLPVNIGTRVQARCFSANGDPIDGIPLRWSLSDSSQATISDSGVVVPKRPGNIRIRASAGGWRSAEVTVHAGASRADTIAVERWDGASADRWVSFGTPLPSIVRLHGRAAFWNRGDGDHFSGAYSSRRYPTKGGLWMEASLSTPITRTQWQVTMMHIASVRAQSELDAWDHRVGYMPGQIAEMCGFAYPHGEGRAAMRKVGGAGDIARIVGYPTDSLARGGWYSVLLQLLPDRRCAIAIDGVPIAIGSPFAEKRDSAIFVLQGSSVATQILVGPVTMGHGVRSDVPWASLEH